jgi:GNAT superfamily N-acetyltransferase
MQYRTSQSLVDLYRAFPLVANLDTYYPDFANWYWNKVLPSALTGGSFVVLAEQEGQVVGAAITKRGVEPKLRCVRVLPQLQGRGVALHLIDRALQGLGVDKPELTVPEELIHDYSRILVNRYSFDLTKVDKGLYRRGKLEYQFNSHNNQRITTAY